MNETKRFRPPIRLLIIAAILLIAGLLVQPITSKPPENVTASTVLVTGIPFLLIFVAILLTYIALIVTISRYYSNRITENRFNPVFYACTAGIIIGILLMFQPFELILFTIGFLLLLLSLLSFIAVSHITPRKGAVETQE